VWIMKKTMLAMVLMLVAVVNMPAADEVTPDG
jgi:hypothetical protein